MNAIPESLRRIWEMISSDEYFSSSQYFLPWGVYKVPNWLPDGHVNLTARTELLRQFTPFIHFGARSLRMRELENRMSDDSDKSISYYVEAEVRLVGRDRAKGIIASLTKEEHYKELLASMADDLTSLLKLALDLFAAVGRANENDDPSWSDLPSVSTHDQNQHFREWSFLIELLRDSFSATAELEPSKAQTIFGRWRTFQYPTFRRLMINALTEWKSQ
jgi:hypothetical protein